ncbi:putative CoA-substrate-specific enzyme activase [Lachnospiraceae bacterium PFB1-21]|uniref:acyl-CoA dehydratase activase n=1 Tax=Ohessyouella blattaphilus TaxID=2949333 RepID=UPI003E202288
MYYVGIDIGSTASKVVVLGEKEEAFVLPTGWNSKETAGLIKKRLQGAAISLAEGKAKVVATGYGRVAVDYADAIITEITCHGRGGFELAGADCAIIDVGGQDTKFIVIENGVVGDFVMNDKCSAGTGKFLEVMANRLGITFEELFALAEGGEVLPISSLCTVFAESEIINHIGNGKKREDIAAGIVDSVAGKVSQLVRSAQLPEKVILTGGLSDNEYFVQCLGAKLEHKVQGTEKGRYAGALGAALLAKEKKRLGI